MHWLSGQMPLTNQPMLLGTVEAMKAMVSLGLGMSIVPDIAVAQPIPNIVVRPLKPPIACTLALIERRDKPSDRALEIVRDALLELRRQPHGRVSATAPWAACPVGLGV
jgi:DNA-binding transcriptional LysR family regulator